MIDVFTINSSNSKILAFFNLNTTCLKIETIQVTFPYINAKIIKTKKYTKTACFCWVVFSKCS